MTDYQLLGFHWLEWIAFVSSILYTLLAARRSIWCWLFGFLGAAFTLVLCLQVRLYSESVLQVFYMAMAVYGWTAWKGQNQQSSSFRIIGMSLRDHIITIITGGLSAILLGYIFEQLDAALPYLDAMTTGFSLVATWLIARRFLENWLYWIIIDAVSIYLYMSRGLYLLSLLFLIYTLLATYGYVLWRKSYREKTN